MRKVFPVLPLLLVFTTLLANADDKHYGPVNVASASLSGDQVRGPIDVLIVGINPVRANVKVGINVTYTPGPDLTLPFIPPLPKSGAQTTTAPLQGGAPSTVGASGTVANARAHAVIARNTLPQPPDVGLTFSALVDNLNEYEQTRYALQGNIQTMIDAVNAATSQVAGFVSSSDVSLKADPTGATLLPRIPPIFNGPIATAISEQWPNSDISTLEGNLSVLKDSLAALPDNAGWAAWVATASNKTAYDSAVTRVNDLLSLAANLESSTNKSASTMSDSQSKLRQWDSVLRAVVTGGMSSFSATVPVTCSFGFSTNKNGEVDLVSTDYLAPVGTAASKQQIVTVICSSPLSISAGFGFSTVPERQVSLVQSLNSSNQVISIFGYTAKSDFQPLPLLFLNTRVYEWNDDWALHVSNGAVVDIKTGAAGGTAVEYASGLSISFRRTLFITTAFLAGRTQSLAGGFTIGQPVPSGVSTPPVENRWTPGFVLAFSYKLK